MCAITLAPEQPGQSVHLFVVWLEVSLDVWPKQANVSELSGLHRDTPIPWTNNGKTS
jgi:hypothetical protein